MIHLNNEHPPAEPQTTIALEDLPPSAILLLLDAVMGDAQTTNFIVKGIPLISTGNLTDQGQALLTEYRTNRAAECGAAL